jgi:hypothetical protein
MQPNTSKLACAIGALLLGASSASNAATELFGFSATTIADVGLVQVNGGIDFGQNVFTTAGTCTLNGVLPTDATLQIDTTTGAAAAVDDTGNLSGTNCVEGDNLGTAGIYKVTGTASSIVNITLGSISEAEFTFVPDSNSYGDYNLAPGSAASDDDSVGTLSTTGSTSARVAVADDVGTNLLATANELVFVLGGTLTVLTDLVAEDVYTSSFDVIVTY